MPPNPFSILDFEKPVAELDERIADVKRLSAEEGTDRSAEISELEQARDRLLEEIFSNLAPSDRVLLARHQRRPYTLDYVRLIFDDYLELHGDRLFSDDHAMVGGLAFLDGKPVVFVGQQKGRDLKDRQYRNFGSAKPEGYRKALRLMKLAEKHGRPVICLVDTPAADCSVEAEQRGISEAIARNLLEMAALETPIVIAILGEGGSGGAIGIGVGDRVMMLENSIYSVIPPEGCAAIIWRDPNRWPDAAAALKLTAQDAQELGVIDEIIPEPLGAAHRNYEQAAKNLKSAISKALAELEKLPIPELLEKRYRKFRGMGICTDLDAVSEGKERKRTGKK